MNVDNMRAVANLIELEDRFWYGNWTSGIGDDNGDLETAARLNECGTSACVAGWAAHLALREGFKSDASCIGDFAADFLGLTDDEANRLFFAHHIRFADRDWLDTTAVEIAKFLRQAADGEVAL